MATRKKWTKTVEEHGIRVRLYRRSGGQCIYREVRLEGRKDRKSLGHSDTRLAEEQGRALAREIASAKLMGIQLGGATFGDVRRAYMHHRGPLLSPDRLQFIERVLGLFSQFLEPGDRPFSMDDFRQHHTDAYLAARRSGKVGPDDHGVSSPRAGTLRNELRALSTACGWAVGFKVGGRRLLAHNPVRDVILPQERNVKRPVASRERFERLLGVSDQVDNRGQFRANLVVAWHTGRRIGAIVHLKASDLLLSPGRVRQALAASGRDESDADEWPHAIRWRAEHDKGRYETITPVGPSVVRELGMYLCGNPCVGDAWLFTTVRDGSQPANRRTATRYLVRAETLAGLPRLERGGWHSFRRAWATARKGMPEKDVMAAGGWRAAEALRTAYQAADPKTTREVVEFGETG